MPTGRPTKFDPKYCDEIIEFMADGYSLTAWAGSIRVARSTVYKWAEDNPSFSDALKVAQAVSAKWWEDIARHNAKTGEGAASTIIFGLKNRVADEWRDKREVDNTSSDGTMTPKAGIDLSKAPDEVLQWIVSQADDASSD